MSIVAMKKKMEAKRGLSTGGKGFSLNPKVKCSDVNSTTVKSSRQARQNLVKRAVCFSGSEGIQCERVWDGRRAPDCMGAGDSMTQNEYLEKRELMQLVAKNVVINFLNAKSNISEVIVEYDTEKAVYEIEFLGKKYQVDWNHSNSYIGSVLSTIGGVEINSGLECVASNSLIAVVASATSNKYVFNANDPIQPTGGYNSDLSFGLYDGNYTIDNPHSQHPMAFLNKDPNNGNIVGLTYTIDDSEPIVIKVSGGSTSLTSGDTFVFRDSNDNAITIGDSSTGFRFMRHRTYRFINNGISNGFGMKVYIDGGVDGIIETDTLGYTGSSTNNITTVSTPESAVTVINGNQYRLNGATGTTDISYGMINGTYRLTGIPEANPLGIVSGNGLTYSVDDSAGPIVINVTGGSASTNAGGDYYTFTDSGGNAISLGNGGFKFMRGRSYRFQVGAGGITDGHQFKLYANGSVSSDGLGNSVATSTPAGCLDPDVAVDVTAIKTTENGTDFYNLSTFNVYDGTYRFTNISQSDPIAFLNAGVAGFNYSVDDSTPIVITVTGGSTTADLSGDYYTFTDSGGNAISLADGGFKFMRGRTYRFEADGIGSSHPFKLYHNNSFVISSNGGTSDSISGTGHSITVTILPNHPFPVTANMLYYQCGQHPSMQANLALSMLDVGGMEYDFFLWDCYCYNWFRV